jgi:polyphosphate glucokinase
MQAVGSYEGGRMLFFGLGTGLGTTLIVDGVVVPLEIGHLPFRKHTFEDYVGDRGREKYGRKRWRAAVFETIEESARHSAPTRSCSEVARPIDWASCRWAAG